MRHVNFKRERNKKLISQLNEMRKIMSLREATIRLSKFGQKVYDLTPERIEKIYRDYKDYFLKGNDNEK